MRRPLKRICYGGSSTEELADIQACEDSDEVLSLAAGSDGKIRYDDYAKAVA